MEITHLDGHGDGNIDLILQNSDQRLKDIAYKLRKIIAELLPGVIEIVWEKQKISSYGIGPKKMSEHFCYIGMYKKHVNLGFYFGALLNDEKGYLNGTGKKLRHIKIESVDQVDDTVKKLIKQSINHINEKNKN